MSKARDIASAIPAPSTVDATELGYLDGVTSAIQTQLDAKTAKSTLTTTGDIYYASAANTPARLGIGSTSNVLTVAGGIPSWAAPASGAYTSIASGSLSGTSVVISTISGSYKHLYLVVVNPVASSGRIGLRINGDTGSNYQYWRAEMDTATPLVNASPSTVINVGGDITSAVNWTYTFFIENYSVADLYKPITVHHRKNASSNATSGWAGHNSATAITSLTMVNTDAVSYTAGTYTLYGVN